MHSGGGVFDEEDYSKRPYLQLINNCTKRKLKAEASFFQLTLEMNRSTHLVIMLSNNGWQCVWGGAKTHDGEIPDIFTKV